MMRFNGGMNENHRPETRLQNLHAGYELANENTDPEASEKCRNCEIRSQFAGRLRSAHARAERLARGGTYVRQSIGDEPHFAAPAATTRRPAARQDAVRHETDGQALTLIGPVKAVLRDIRNLLNAEEEFVPATSARRFVIAATDYMDFLIVPALVERIARTAPGVDIHIKRTETPFPERSWNTMISIWCWGSRRS